MNTVAIVQARLGSTRFPRKVLARVGGLPMLTRVVQAALASRVDKVAVAVPLPDFDEIHAALGHLRGRWFVYPGPAEPLARLQHVARFTQADRVVRLTGDCPFLPPAVIDLAIDCAERHPSRIVYTHHDRQPSPWPEGFDVEVFLASALLALTPPDEHVTTGLYPGVAVPGPWSPGKLSIDTPAELATILCELCNAGAPHHTNSLTSIGGCDRIVKHDLHEVTDASGVGLAECLAYDDCWRDHDES